MKLEQTECSETSAYKIQTPGNSPEESIQHVFKSLSLSVFTSRDAITVIYTSTLEPIFMKQDAITSRFVLVHCSLPAVIVGVVVTPNW